LAKTQALAAVCDGIARILTSAAEDEKTALGFGDLDLAFSVYNASDFSDSDSSRHVTTGASIYLYRALPNLSHRTPPGRLQPNGTRKRTRLPLDAHLLVTIWANAPDTQNRLLGWVLRTLEDYPTLPASLLNLTVADTFDPDESVEFTLNEMPTDELLHLWERLGGDSPYQPSIPYLARAIFVDSERELTPAEPVQVRTFDLRRLTESDS
jgi:hypothetical protein